MKEVGKNIQSIFKHQSMKILLLTLGIILSIMIIFSIGMAVGFRKGQFSDRWDRNYMGVMMGSQRSTFSAFSDTDRRAPSPHGTTGQVISSNNGQFVVSGPGDTESFVIIGPRTIIRQLHEQGTTTDIKAGSWITAIGSPDDKGRIVATFIRIMPAPPQSASSTIK